MEKLKALQEELAHIDANAHNLADPNAAANSKLREIISELIGIVTNMDPASSADRVVNVDETENLGKPSLQAAVADLDSRVSAIEQHPALSIPPLDAPAPSAAPAKAPESTTSLANSDSAVQAGAAVSTGQDAQQP